MISWAPGVELFKKDYPNGSPDFVQVVNLGLGARIELLHGELTETRPTKGSFGGPDPRMTSLSLQNYWAKIAEREPLAFCVINGGFFYMPEYPTRLAFPLKKDGQIVTEGWGIDTYPDKKLILELQPGTADIKLLSEKTLYESDAPNILGGLAEDANKRIKSSVGRTFVGIDDRDGDQEFETVIFLSTRTHYQSGAASVLRSFGANKIMMLDGGGSTQLLCRDGHFIPSDRLIPQAVAIIAAEPPVVAAQISRAPTWQVLLPGERIPFEIEIQNIGTRTWTVEDAQITLDVHTQASAEWLALAAAVEPGATVAVSDTLIAPDATGVHLLEVAWSVTSGEETSTEQTVIAPIIVLPENLTGERSMVVEQLHGAGGLPVEEVQSRLESWLAQSGGISQAGDPPPAGAAQVRPPAGDATRLADILWIPVIMLPIVVLLGFKISRKATS